ncbi:MAG: T9SS type A sorting domain-containing protein [Flavobacteriales bacterium]|nr:T9SS type A sorting domain-containing protein [Flavobacteriales bacterium]
MKKLLSFLASVGFFGGQLFAQCPAGEVAAAIEVTTDAWGYETYWEIVPTGDACGTNTVTSGGNTVFGCSGTAAAPTDAGAYANNATISGGTFCLVDGAQYDLIERDQYGDGGSSFTVITNPSVSYTSAGTGGTHTFTAGALPSDDAELVSVSSTDYVTSGGNIDITGVIANKGSNTITSIDISWDNGAGPQTQTVSGLNIALGESGSFTHPTQMSVANVGEYNVTVTLSQTNDADLTNNDASFITTGLDNPPVRTHVFEEATGTWCGWCPRGAVGLQNLESESNAIGIAVHNGDPMVVTAYDNGIGNFIGGYPSGLVNRSDKMTGAFDIDPGAFMTVLGGSELTTISPFGVTVEGSNWDATARTVDITLTVTVHTDLVGDYRCNVVLVEDNIQETSSAYDQSNYYASNSIELLTTDVDGNQVDWQDLGATVPAADMNSIFGGHQHVARSLEGGWDGVANSLPSTMSNGDTTTYTFTGVSIDAAWKMGNLTAVGWVSSKANGEILNAKQTNYLWTVTSVAEVATEGFATKVYPNPNNGVFNLMVSSSKSETYQISVTNMIGQSVYSENLSVNGVGSTTLDLSSFDKGIYFVTVKGAESESTSKVIIK